MKLKEGEKLINQGKNEIHMVGKGKLAYLWIGGNGCYGTLSGQKSLEKLAYQILRAINERGSIISKEIQPELWDEALSLAKEDGIQEVIKQFKISRID